MMKTGENSILKENCEKFMKEVRTTAEQARQDKFHDAQERAKMKEEFDKELKNQSMAHQFDVSVTVCVRRTLKIAIRIKRMHADLAPVFYFFSLLPDIQHAKDESFGSRQVIRNS